MAERRRWSGRERGGRVGHLFFALLVRCGGLALTPFFVFWVALYFVAASPQGRRASFELADRVGRGGTLLRRLRFALRHFYTFGTILVDRFAILSGKVERYSFREYGREIMETAAKEGHGIVLVTAHVGNWTIMGHLLDDLGKTVTLVMHDAVQPAMRETMEKLARGRAFRVLYTEGSPASAAEIMEALKRGEFVGMMGDRLLAGEGVAVPFLGGRARFPVGPYAIAASTGAPVIHVFGTRSGRRRYDFHARAVGVLRYADRRRKAPDLARWAQDFAATLEDLVRAHPEQWGNFYPFWEPAP
ncbi:MAG: LpxL/LpxP family acyltransferase [Planctomycetota bacterium]|jgi:predicted LPLAT superfamily acyltransferase